MTAETPQVLPSSMRFVDEAGELLWSSSADYQLYLHAMVAKEGDLGLYEVVAIERQGDAFLVGLRRCPYDAW